MIIKQKTWELAGWCSLVASAGFVFTLPIFLVIAWLQNEVSWLGSVSTNTYGRHSGGELIILALPSLLLLFILRKNPRYRNKLSATAEELKPVMYFGFGVAGILFLTFLLNLNWFYTHETIRFIVGIVVLWSLIFATVAGFSEAPVKK